MSYIAKYRFLFSQTNDRANNREVTVFGSDYAEAESKAKDFWNMSMIDNTTIDLLDIVEVAPHA